MSPSRSIPFALLGAATLVGLSCSQRPPTIVLTSAAAGFEDSIVYADLPAGFEGEPCCVLSSDSAEEIAAQVLPQEPGRIAWLLEAPLEAGGSRTYRIEKRSPARERVALIRADGRLRVAIDGRDVFVYNEAVVEPPEGTDRLFRRSGYIHPAYSPSGRVVTDDFADDHPHQHGIFMAWVNTTYQGRHLDFWNQRLQEGDIRFLATGDLISGAVFGEFTVEHQHWDTAAPEGEKTVLEETWRVRVWAGSQAFVFDIESTQVNVSDSPLTLNEYRYGGMAIRGSRQWLEPQNVKFLTSEGKDRIAGNHTRPVWAAMSGKIDGEAVSVAAMGAPGNFRYPQPVRLNAKDPYLCFAPMVTGAFEIAPAEKFESAYRFVIHDGYADPSRYDRLWGEYRDALAASK
jgi:hypothetical protein